MRGTPRRARSRALRVAASVAALTLLPLAASSPTRAAPSRSELEAAKARLLEIEADFEIVSERYNEVHADLDRIQQEMAAKELVVRSIQTRMRVKETAAVGLATELYKSGGSGVGIDSLLSAETLSELETRIEYLKSSNDAQVQVFERLAVDRLELDHQIADLETAKGEALRTETKLADLRSTIDLKVHEQEDEIAALNQAIQRAEARRQAAVEAAAASSRPSLAYSEPANPAPAPNAQAQAAVDAGLSQVGKPYQWAAAGPDSYDCSGLTMWSWAHAGVSLPHSSSQQYAATPRVSQSDLQPGDLLFFGSPIHHVGMYIGNGQMVEAPYTGAYVRVTAAFRSDFVGAGRPGV
ncbi:MAG: peptidoglycan DL-endopeptidase CwlO [Actinomycetota bacterium]|nr:peptidoglycan DL-endopeptidase CwlO [Actinomycetota bacterium]